MIGRVSSLDWVLTLALAPLSYALTGPIAGAFGARSTLLWCGVVGAVVLALVYVAVPDVRAVAASEEEADDSTAAAA
jgi:DHA3 family tetracycline resistance protein-like MFS transporter